MKRKLITNYHFYIHATVYRKGTNNDLYLENVKHAKLWLTKLILFATTINTYSKS